jgi:hypothetical protein
MQMKAERPDVSVIVVSYNTRELTLECIASVYEHTHETSFEIIVLDNASADDSADAIRAEFPGLRLIHLAENVGFGNGVNFAASKARGAHVLLLNPDARVIDGAIDTIVDFTRENPSYGIVGGISLGEDGRSTNDSAWRAPTLWSLFCRATGLAWAFTGVPFLNPSRAFIRGDEPQDVDIVSGCFLVSPSETWQALGGFDPQFFMYGEDVDLSLRARQKGYEVCVVPQARIFHVGGASERIASDRLVRIFRAKVQQMDIHWDDGSASWGRALLSLWALLRRVGYRLAALVCGAPAREAATAWDAVWHDRDEFLHPQQREPVRIQELAG